MFQDTFGMRLRGAYLTFHRFGNAYCEQFGMTADQFVVLSLLTEEDGITQRQVAERSYSDANTIAAMLARLEKKKLVRRERHPTDGRARRVGLTSQGRKVQRHVWESWKRLLKELDDAFHSEELQALKSLLERVPRVVGELRDRYLATQ